MTCLCGHTEAVHRAKRGACCGDVRMYINLVPSYKIHPGDRVLTKKEAEKVVNEAADKVEKAPSYEKQFIAMLKRGYVTIPCQCTLYHELALPSEETGITLWDPQGNPAA